MFSLRVCVCVFSLCVHPVCARVSSDMTTITRKAGGKVWKDASLAEWSPNDYRIFVGNLGNEVSDEMVSAIFRTYKSFQKAKVVRDKRTMKTRGYGFVSFSDPVDMVAALREVDGKYIGNRPCMLKKSKWEERNIDSEKNLSAEPIIHAIPQSVRNIQKFKRAAKK